MKILEIIQEYDATDQQIRYRKPDYDYDTLQNRGERSSDSAAKKGVQPGWYSGGQTNPRDPHEFIKRPHLTALLDQDAYYKYVMEIRDLKREGYHNRFFPQVYNIDIVQDPKGNQRPRYRIEKLQQGTSYPEEALIGMYEQLFFGEFDTNIIDFADNKSQAVWSEIADQCNRAVERSNYTQIRDQELIEALMLIDRIIQENPDWNVDLHRNNIRVRGSSVGPQLVLMDPISDGGQSIPNYDQVKSGPRPNKNIPPAPPPNAAQEDPKKNTGLGTALKRALKRQLDQDRLQRDLDQNTD